MGGYAVKPAPFPKFFWLHLFFSKKRCELSIGSDYFASSMVRVSRITLTLIWPG